jgi:hypothetical protein
LLAVVAPGGLDDAGMVPFRPPMRCPSCSSEVAESARFCPGCGSPVAQATSTPTRTVHHGRPAADESPGSGLAGDDRFAPGTLLAGRYRIIGLLGRGGMGEVYRADDLKLGRPVALKFLPAGLESEPGRLGRFLTEVRLALNVTHPNVCRVHDIAEAGGHNFISMEYVDGEDLASLLRRIGRFPGDRAIRVARQLCAGLAAAHEQGILHRDLKPGNVMIDGRGQVKITDFGLARIAAEIKGPESRLGTPAYMAPEQLAGREVTVRSDIYALGLVLYELFTGRHAFEGRTPAERQRHPSSATPMSPASLVDGIDPAVERVILRCLERDANLRPSSAIAVTAALPGGDPIAAALAAGETPSPELLAEAGQSGGLRPLLAWAGLAAFLLGLGLVVLLADRSQLILMVPLDKPPEVLTSRAQEILRASGYADKPADQLHCFLPNNDYLSHLEKLGTRADIPKAMRAGRPAGMLFWYRQSPAPLIRQGPATIGDWFTDPPNTAPGMAQVVLDPQGRLQSLAAVPPDRTGPEERESPTDWRPLLAAAELDPASLKEAAPSWAPPVYADRRVAWEGTYPGAPDVPIHVEAAACGGRPVWFRILEPWVETTTREAPPDPGRSRVSELVMAAAFVVMLTGAAILAVRNVRLGRGDRRTALRFALYLGAARMVWFLGAHHLATQNEITIFMGHLSYALQRFGLVWILYMALEPYARRLWPQMLVSWVRLFDGRLRDPLVGRDLLIGSLAGIVVALTQRLVRGYTGALGLKPFLPDADAIDFEALRGLRHAVTMVAIAHTLSVLDFLVPVTLFLVFRVLTRRTWAAIVVVSLIGFVGLYPGAGNLTVWIAGTVPLMVMFWYLYLRVGLLPLILCASIKDLVVHLPLTFDLSSWYAPAGLPALLVVLLVAYWGFRTSVAGRPLFRDEILEGDALPRAAG